MHVSLRGNDKNPGSSAAPVRTLTRGLAIAPTGGTVVLQRRRLPRVGRHQPAGHHPERAGRRRCGSTGARRSAVGSRAGTGGARSGWTHPLRPQPRATRRARRTGPATGSSSTAPTRWPPTRTRSGSTGSPQAQVAFAVATGPPDVLPRRGQLPSCTSAATPRARIVDASILAKALSVRAAGVIIRGIGVRRYAPSVWMVAGITLEQPSARVENVVVEDMATIGISALRDRHHHRPRHDRDGQRDARPPRSLRRPSHAERGARRHGNNDEHFNMTPNAGGVQDRPDPRG